MIIEAIDGRGMLAVTVLKMLVSVFPLARLETRTLASYDRPSFTMDAVVDSGVTFASWSVASSSER